MKLHITNPSLQAVQNYAIHRAGHRQRFPKLCNYDYGSVEQLAKLLEAAKPEKKSLAAEYNRSYCRYIESIFNNFSEIFDLSRKVVAKNVAKSVYRRLHSYLGTTSNFSELISKCKEKVGEEKDYRDLAKRALLNLHSSTSSQLRRYFSWTPSGFKQPFFDQGKQSVRTVGLADHEGVGAIAKSLCHMVNSFKQLDFNLQQEQEENPLSFDKYVDKLFAIEPAYNEQKEIADEIETILK